MHNQISYIYRQGTCCVKDTYISTSVQKTGSSYYMADESQRESAAAQSEQEDPDNEHDDHDMSSQHSDDAMTDDSLPDETIEPEGSILYDNVREEDIVGVRADTMVRIIAPDGRTMIIARLVEVIESLHHIILWFNGVSYSGLSSLGQTLEDGADADGSSSDSDSDDTD